MTATETPSAHRPPETHGHAAPASGGALALLSLTALGVVYGDIGTSPLYALKECFHGPHGIEPSAANVLGVLSLVLWALIVVISIKYIAFVMRADNRGEGGILALTALVTPLRGSKQGERWLLVMLGIFGAALLYGDGMVTPAISVLSAVEGLEIATPALEPYVLPITIAILVGLFFIQSKGTARVGKVFGPVTLVWFLVLALLGVAHILRNPAVLAAANPAHGLAFFAHNGRHGYLVLGSVFLVVTGGEALYADMGHFGVKPIRLAWFVVVLPALVLNYFGQGALLLSSPEAAENPLYLMAPDWALYPIIALATMATVIASQALISGAFSLTMQAVQLGFSPRVDIEHTSQTERGQIYIPGVNWALLAACIGLVLGFRTSSNLAAAYGLAVTSTMAITTILFFVVLRDRWGWNPAAAGALCGLFLVIDLAFLGATAIKFLDGGWFPVVVAVLIFTVMSTWKTGRRILGERLRMASTPLREFLASLDARRPIRVPGTAVFMYSNREGTPPALLHNLEHNKVLHEDVVILNIATMEVPHVLPAERVEVEALDHNFYRIVLSYGFMEEPNVPEALAAVEVPGLELRPESTTYFLGHETLIPTREVPGMAVWRERLFVLMTKNARRATRYFSIPADRVVELGSQIRL